ncbi:hypothetical protein COOONC_23643 [Cooperia oncophora]
MSAEETSDEDDVKEENLLMKTILLHQTVMFLAANPLNDPEALLRRCHDFMEEAQNRFELATIEKAARLILELADIVGKSGNSDNITDMAVNVAEDVIKRVESVRRRPISTTSQLLNHLSAQCGFVKVSLNILFSGV